MHVCPSCGYSDSELVKDNPDEWDIVHLPRKHYERLLWLEKKAKKCEELSKSTPVTVIEKDAMLVNINYFDQIKEKARKYDEIKKLLGD